MQTRFGFNASVLANAWTEAKACSRLAMPLVIAQITDSITGLIDTVMMGWLGSESIAAGALGAMFFNYLLWVVTSILSAVNPLTAQAHGAGNTKEIRWLLHQGLWLTGLIGLPMAFVIWNGGFLLHAFGQEPEAIALADQYLKAIAWGFIPALGISVLKGFVSALSRPKVVMLIVFIGILLNVAGNYVLMLGKGGIPALGLAGVGWSSSLAFWGMFLAMMAYICASKDFQDYRLATKLRFNRKVSRQILQVGLPICGLVAIESSISAAGTFLSGQLGIEALAAYQVVFQTASMLTYQVSSGIAMATTVRVGQMLGKGDHSSSKFSGVIGIGVSGLCMAAFSLAFALIPDQIIGLYLDPSQTSNKEVAALAKTLLLAAAMFQVFDGVQVTATGALRGLNDNQVPMVMSFIAHGCIGLPIGYVLGMKLGLGVVGLWLGMTTGLICAAFILVWRFIVVANRMIQISFNLKQTQKLSQSFQSLLMRKTEITMRQAMTRNLPQNLVQPEFSPLQGAGMMRQASMGGLAYKLIQPEFTPLENSDSSLG